MPIDKEKQYQSKARLLVLLKMFYELTDKDHTMTNVEIIDYLEKENVQANLATLRDDIALLKKHGYDIRTIVSRPNRYYWGEREFELSELKLLVDAVASSRFITESKSKVLSRKLYQFSSKHQRRGIKRNIAAVKRIKTDNEEIYKIIDTVNDAINRKKKIAFQYTEYNAKAKKILRNAGEVYELSPYALFWNDDNYYVVGWSEKHNNVSVFRADRLYAVAVLPERAEKRPEGFSLEDYSKRIFEMYDGEPVAVRLKCRNDLMKYIVDRFGDDIEVKTADKDHVIVTVSVSLSPTFYGWVFQFEGGIKILSPKKAEKKISEMAQIIIDG